MKAIMLLILSTLLSACSSDPHQPHPSSGEICQGFGCSTAPGKLPSRADTHKPTKEEKIRVRQGGTPDFGSDEMSIGGHFPL
ncbi:hypothetical protein ABW286_07990 [Erwinia papayae]|uniref:Lipoprotein n=1 Tax=Erwinia papayae TaxID=206499 RepID=A0ABV3MZX8_9GAMM|nr:hypothetical protein [Erwinia mallotivora]